MTNDLTLAVLLMTSLARETNLSLFIVIIFANPIVYAL